MKEKMAKVFYHYISFLALQETCDWFNANYDTARKWSLHQIINTFKGSSSVWSSLLVFVFSAILYSNFLNHPKRETQYGFNWYISQRIKKILKESWIGIIIAVSVQKRFMYLVLKGTRQTLKQTKKCGDFSL